LTVDTQLSVPDAVGRILADIRRMPVERVALLDASGRVLAEDAVATLTLPPWNNSAMDGYAVRASDLAILPATLRVIETIAAGQFPSRAVGTGEATRIMTGAPVPDGADCVIRYSPARRRYSRRTDRDSRRHRARRRADRRSRVARLRDRSGLSRTARCDSYIGR
jgi:molybdopterin molybdotransferase